MGSLGITSFTAWITALLLSVQALLGLFRVRASAATGSARATNASGLWIATVALLVLAAQAMTGMTMLPQKGRQRIPIRRLHLAIAVILVALAGTQFS